jgi:hypothetical protein
MICPECKGPGTVTALLFRKYHDTQCLTCKGKGEVPGGPTFAVRREDLTECGHLSTEPCEKCQPDHPDVLEHKAKFRAALAKLDIR